MAGPGVIYVITLESKQFLQELSRAKQEAKRAAEEINDGIGSAGNSAANAVKNVGSGAEKASKWLEGLSSIGQEAGDVFRVFQSTTNAFSQALSGNFVGAAGNAAKAFQGLTAAMEANPILLVVAAVGALAIALSSMADRWRDYKNRIREAKQETEDFYKRLDELRWGNPAENYVSGMSAAFGNALASGNPELVENQKKAAEERRDAARSRAEAAQKEVQKWETAPIAGGMFSFSPNNGYDKEFVEAQLEAAKKERDAAQAEYEKELAVLQQYEALIAAEEKADKDAADAEAKNIEDRKAANAAEAQRLKEGLAEGSSEAMRKVADEMAAEFEKKFGKGSLESYAGRVAGGGVGQDEIDAYKQVEAYRKKVADQIKREEEETARAQEKVAMEAKHAALEAEQAARKAAIEAQKTAAAEQKLARTREEVLAATKNADELQKLANQKRGEADMAFGEWYAGKEMGQEEMDARLEAQRLNDRAKSIRDAQQREREQTEREAENARKQAQQEAREKREDWRKRAVAMGDADALEAEAKRQVEEADKKFGTGNSWKDMSKEEWARREWADTLYQDAKKIRGEEPEEKPWAVGVTAVRGMSVADVFTAMRGMGGAQVARDPNLDANQKTAKNTKTMAERIGQIANALSAEGVH